MPRSSYDVVVIGRDLAATVAGTLLSQRGLRVLSVSAEGDPPLAAPGPGGAPAPVDRYSLGPYVLPTSPMQLIGPDAPGLKQVLAELSLAQLFRRRIEPNRPAFQLLLPDQRIDVDDDLTRALEREAPAALPAYERVSARITEVSAKMESILAEEVMLPPDGFWDRRDGKRVAARLPDDEGDLLAEASAGLDPASSAVLRGLVELPARFHVDFDRPGPVATARAADLWRRGSYRIDGGRDGLRGLFIERLRAQGSEHRPELRAARIQVRRGRVVSVDVGQSEGEIGCEHVIAGQAAHATMALLDGDRPSKRLVEAAAIVPALHRYLLHLIVPLEVLPDALGRVAYSVRDPEAPWLEDNALRLHLADGYGQHAVLSAEALTVNPDPAALQALRKRIRAHLEALLPFVSRHLLCVHSPHDGLPPEGVNEPAPPPRPMDRVWAIPGPRVLGVCGVPYDSGIRGLHLSGRQALPGLGLEGELEGALRVAKLVSAGTKKRDASGAVLR